MKGNVRKVQRFAVLVLVAMLALSLAPSQVAVQAQDEPTVYEVTAFPSFSFVPFFIAQEKGFFEEEGLQVNLSVYTAYEDLLRAMLGSGGAISVSFPHTVATSGTVPGLNSVLVGIFDVNAGEVNLVLGTSVELEDVERIAMAGGINIWMLYIWDYLVEEGIDPTAIEFVNVPAADVIDNLSVGRIQGFISGTNVAGPAVAAGVGTIVFTHESYTSCAISAALLEEMPFEDQKALWRALIKTNEWLSDPENKDEFQEILIDVWGDYAAVGADMSNDALFNTLYENHTFLAGEELLEVNQEMETFIQQGIDFNEMQGMDLSEFVMEDVVDQTALYEVLADMGYEMPESDSD